MKSLQNVLIFGLSVFFGWLQAQVNNVQDAESLTYRIHYGFLNAGTAQLTARQQLFNGKPHLRVIGRGKSTGAVRAFFRVDDLYESYIDMATGLPTQYTRNIQEGGFSQHLIARFNHSSANVHLTNIKDKTTQNLVARPGVQDMLSAFYYLRTIEASRLRVGNVLQLQVWIDDHPFDFRLRVAGVENVFTRFGSVECLKIIPSVMSGRIFRDSESVVLYVTNDANHIPVEISAKLIVGKLKASLQDYKNVKYPIVFK